MSKPLSRQVTFARLSYHLSGEEPANKNAAGPTTFGKPKTLDEGGHVKASMLPEVFQHILTPKTPMELELILSQMAQKPMLRGEVGARALRVRSDVRGHG